MRKALITSIYYLPGRNGTISEGLGTFLREQCNQLLGKEVSGDLKGLVFADQPEAIRKDLQQSCLEMDESSPILFDEFLNEISNFKHEIEKLDTKLLAYETI